MTFMHLVGMTVEEAEQHYTPIRVTMIDGMPLLTTCDWRPERLNVTIRAGRIETIRGLG